MNNLPVIPTPVFPRYIWMEEITFSHIPIATIITAFMILAPIYELIGVRKQDPRYDRFARSLIWFSLIIFSPGAALGTGIPMVIIGLYPEFWARWANLFFWPLIIQFVFFLLEVTFLFFFYYLVWDRWQDPRRKRIHIAMGFVAATFGLLIQFVWDAVGGYMHTPNGVELPGAVEAVGWNAQAFFNPSFLPLTLHRFFGNISYTMLLVGGVFAIKHMRAKDPEEHAYYGWSSDLAFKVGFIAFFAMPVIGWFYSSVLQAEAPVAFNAIMGGHTAKYFNVKMAGIAFFVAVASMYVFVRHREKKKLLYVVTALLASLYFFLAIHPPIDWLPGPPVVWRTSYTVVLGGFIAYLWYLRKNGKEFSISRKRWPVSMLAAGLVAMLVFFLGGFSRERSRQPHTVYGQLAKPEATAEERTRFLVYANCLDEHTISQIQGMDLDNWSDDRILSELCGTGDYTDAEGDRIARMIKEGNL
jgi:cytochrome bd-type quinol oxidase subunit 1